MRRCTSVVWCTIKKTKKERGRMIRSTETNPIVMSSVVRGEWRVTFGKTRIGLK